MDLIYGVSQVLHRIKLKLYPNYLPGKEGTFHARTSSEATLTIEQVRASRRDRGTKGRQGKSRDNVFVFILLRVLCELCEKYCQKCSVSTGCSGIPVQPV